MFRMCLNLTKISLNTVNIYIPIISSKDYPQEKLHLNYIKS